MSAIANPAPIAPKPPAPVAAPPASGGRRWLWGLLAVVVLGGVGYWQWQARQQVARDAVAIPVKTVKVAVAPLETRIRISGQTTAREFANINVPRLNSPESNRPLVIQDLVATGKMVRKGDIICQIDGQSLQDHIDDVHSFVVQAEADVKKRRAEQEVEWASLQQTIRVSKADLDKLRADARAAEVRTAIDQELIKLAVEEADAAYRELLEEAKLKQAAFVSELKILDATRERHRRHRDRHKKDLERFTMRAPMDGMAVTQSVWRGGEFQPIGDGDQVFPGQLIVKVVNPRSIQLEANVNQTESGRFRIGQTAKVKLDAFPDLPFQGKVYALGAIAVSGFRQQAYLRNIPIRVAIENQGEKLIPDLSGSADVLVEAQTDPAPVVPLGAVKTDGSAKAFAWVKDRDQFVRREVTLGERNATEATVLAGLSAGDEVALNYEPPAVK